MSESIKMVRIFISSPGDVAEERDTAIRVIKQLQRRYLHRLQLEPILWEQLALTADMPFQMAIDRIVESHTVDIAVFILWSRIGSKVTIGDREYNSGTEREFDMMLRARQQSDDVSPQIIVYTREDDMSFQERLRNQSTEAIKDIIQQKEKLETFKSEHFYDTEKQENRRAYHTYTAPTTFRASLRAHLIQMLDEMAGEYQGESIWNIDEQGAPFRGLEAFQYEHRDVFFGREIESLEVHEALKQQANRGCSFILLSGASGSGKSSLARAGVMPSIVDMELDQQVGAWVHFSFTPGQYAGDLIRGLAKEIADVLPGLYTEDPDLNDLVDSLSKDPDLAYKLLISRALKKACADDVHGETRLLILVDQLEELFTDARISRADCEQFVEVLNRLSRCGAIWILATVRSDFYAHCETLDTLMEMVGTGGHYSVRLPGADALRRLITEPAHVAGLRYQKHKDKLLDSLILDEASEHAELLPLLQYLLLELYENREGDLLVFKAYEDFSSYTQNGEKLGGLRGALAKKARDTYMAVEPENAVFHKVMNGLVTISGDDEESAVRQVADYEAMTDTTAKKQMIDAFVEARLLTTLGEQSREAKVTIAHESLLRVWDRAIHWVAENKEMLRVRAQLRQRMKLGGLINKNEPLLDRAKQLLSVHRDDLESDVIHFIEDSVMAVEHHDMRLRRIRNTVVVVLSALVVLASAAAVFAGKQYLTANASKVLAENQKLEAEEQKQFAEEQKQLAEEQTQIAVDSSRLADQERRNAETHIAALYAEQGRAALNKHEYEAASVFLAAALKYEKENAVYNLLFARSLNLLTARTQGKFSGHTGGITAMLVNQDEGMLITAGQDLSIKFWDMQTRKVLRSIDISSPVQELYLDNGDLICQYSNFIEVYDANSFELKYECLGHSDRIHSFSIQGDLFLTSGDDRQTILWSRKEQGKAVKKLLRSDIIFTDFYDEWEFVQLSKTGKLEFVNFKPDEIIAVRSQQLSGESYSEQNIYHSVLSRDKSMLFTTASGELKAYHLNNDQQNAVSFHIPTQRMIRLILLEHGRLLVEEQDYIHLIQYEEADGFKHDRLANDNYDHVQFASDSLLASKGQKHTQYAYNGFKKIREFAFAGPVSQSLTLNNSFLISNQSGDIKQQSFDDNFIQHNENLDQSIFFNRQEDDDLLIGTEDSKLLRINLKTFKQSLEFDHQDGWLKAYDMNPSRNMYITAGGRSVKLWDQQKKFIRSLQIKDDADQLMHILDAAFVDDHHILVFARLNDSNSGLCRLVTLEGDLVHQTNIGNRDYTRIHLSDDRKLLIAQTMRNIYTFRAQSGDYAGSNRGTAVSFIPGELNSVYGKVNGELIKATFNTNTIHKSRSHQTRVTTIKIQNQLVISGDWDGNIAISDLKDLKLQKKLIAHQHPISDLLLYEGEKILISADRGGEVRFWDIEAGQSILTIKAFNSAIQSLYVFESELVAITVDGQLKKWRLPLNQLDYPSNLKLIMQHIKWNSQDQPDEVQLRKAFNEINDLNVSAQFTERDNLVDILVKMQAADKKEIMKRPRDVNAIAGALAGLKQVIKAHSEEISVIQYIDADHIATASYNGEIKIWNTKNGTLVNTLKHDIVIWHFDVHPASHLLTSCGFHNEVFVWNYKTGELLKRLQGHEKRIAQTHFSNNGEQVITGSRDHTAKLWDIESGDIIQEFVDFKDYIHRANIIGRYIILRSNTQLQLIDRETNDVLNILVGPEELLTEYLRDSHFDESLGLLVVSSGSSIYIWDTAKKQMIQKVSTTNSVYEAKLVDENRVLISVSGSIELWNFRENKKLKEYDHLRDEYTEITVFQDRARFISVSSSLMKMWDLNKADLLLSYNMNNAFQDLALSPDEMTAVTRDDDHHILIWDLETLSHAPQDQLGWIADHTDYSAGYWLYWDKKKIAIQSLSDQRIHEAEIPDNHHVVELLPDASILIYEEQFIVDEDAKDVRKLTFKLMRLVDGALQVVSEHDQSITVEQFKISPDRHRIAVEDENQALVVYELDGFKEVVTHELKKTMTFLEWSPDGTKILWQEDKQAVMICDLEDLEVHRFDVEGLEVVACVFDPQQASVFLALDNRSIQQFSLETHKELSQHYGHVTQIHDLAYLGKTDQLVSFSHDNQYRIWDHETVHVNTLDRKMPVEQFHLVDETLLIVKYVDNHLSFIELQTGKLIPYYARFSQYAHVFIDRDQQRVLFSDDQARTKSFDLKMNQSSYESIQRIRVIK